ncbi:MAG: pilus assembly protein TadG-related protein [Acidimicrobiia bacterium]
MPVDRSAHHHSSGQALPLAVALIAITGLLLIALVPLARAASARSAARTAADLSALAGAAEGEGAAREVAAANGGRLVDFAAAGPDVVVEVEVGGARAEARARRGR